MGNNFALVLDGIFWRAVIVGYFLVMIILIMLSRYYMFKIRRYLYKHSGHSLDGKPFDFTQGRQGADGSKLRLFHMPIISDPVYNGMRMKMYGCYIGYIAMGIFGLIIAARQLLSFYQLPIDL